jgi:hypothetical protein
LINKLIHCTLQNRVVYIHVCIYIYIYVYTDDGKKEPTWLNFRSWKGKSRVEILQ